LLGILAGLFIGFGGFGSIIAMQTLKNVDLGIMKLVGAAVFPIGIILVVVAGAELFTGNNLMTLALIDKKITYRRMFRNWILVYFSNFIGALLLAILIDQAQLLSNDALSLTLSIGEGKTSLSFQVALLRGILCNIIVVLAVWMGAAAQDITSRLFAVWFPIMLFVLSGYEHCVANMFYIPLAKFSGLNVSWTEMWVSNLIPVTIGNIIGGAIFIPIIYYITYIAPTKRK